MPTTNKLGNLVRRAKELYQPLSRVYLDLFDPTTQNAIDLLNLLGDGKEHTLTSLAASMEMTSEQVLEYLKAFHRGKLPFTKAGENNIWQLPPHPVLNKFPKMFEALGYSKARNFRKRKTGKKHQLPLYIPEPEIPQIFTPPPPVTMEINREIKLDEFFQKKGITANQHQTTGAIHNNYSGVVSPNYKFIAIGDEKGFVRVFDVATGELSYILFDFPEYQQTEYIVGDLVISPDSQYLFQIVEEDNCLRVWDLESGSIIHRITELYTYFFRLLLTPDNQKGVTICGDKEILIWDIKSGELLHKFEGHDHLIWGIGISSDGRNLVISSNGIIKVFDLESYEILKQINYELEDPDWLNSPVIFSPNNNLIVCAGAGGITNVWEWQAEKLIHTFDLSYGVNQLAITPDNRILIAANYKGIEFWNLNSGELIHTYTRNIENVMHLQVSANQLSLVYGQQDTKLLIFDQVDWSKF